MLTEHNVVLIELLSNPIQIEKGNNASFAESEK